MPAATVFAATFPTWQVAVGALLAGFASGVLAALLGIGGAVVTTPVVRLLGGTPIEAVGSTVPAIIPGAISGAWRYAREGLVHWRIAGVLGVSGAAMAVVGALVSDAVEGRVLMVLTAVVMLWAGGSVVWRLRVPGRTGAGVADDADEVPEAPDALVAALGAGAGFIAGLAISKPFVAILARPAMPRWPSGGKGPCARRARRRVRCGGLPSGAGCLRSGRARGQDRRG